MTLIRIHAHLLRLTDPHRDQVLICPRPAEKTRTRRRRSNCPFPDSSGERSQRPTHLPCKFTARLSPLPAISPSLLAPSQTTHHETTLILSYTHQPASPIRVYYSPFGPQAVGTQNASISSSTAVSLPLLLKTPALVQPCTHPCQRHLVYNDTKSPHPLLWAFRTPSQPSNRRIRFTFSAH